jgi:phosphoesterase RecJ-like protein
MHQKFCCKAKRILTLCLKVNSADNDYVEFIISKIKKSQRILLSTHKQCDGDGLRAEITLYYALKSIGKDVTLFNVNATPKKYAF